MSYNPEPFHPFDKYEGQVPAELEQANENFKILAQVFKANDPTNLVVKTVPHTYNADKVINAFADTPYFLPYPIFTVLTEGKLPQYGQPYSVYYTIPDNKLYWTDGTSQFGGKIFKVDGSSVPNGYGSGHDWFEIDWTKWITDDPWYRAGKLRIYNGELQVSNDRENWHKVIPTVGETLLFQVDPDPEYNYSTPYNGEDYILYLAPGQTVILNSIYNSFFNVASVSSSCWRCSVYNYYNNTELYGIIPNGKLVYACRTYGIMNAYRYDYNTGTFQVETIAPGFEDLHFIPITMTQKGNITNFDIYIHEDNFYMDSIPEANILIVEDDRMFIVSRGNLGHSNVPTTKASGMSIFASEGLFPRDGYYLGRQAIKNGYKDTSNTGSDAIPSDDVFININADKVIITRMF